MSDQLTGFDDLEELLRDASRMLAVPPTPRMAPRVRARVLAIQVGSPGIAMRWPVSSRWRRPALVALVALALVVFGALAVPPVRDTVARFFHVSGVDLQRLYEERFAHEPFIDVMPPASHPDTRSVRASNVCRIAVHRPYDGDIVVILSVIAMSRSNTFC